MNCTQAHSLIQAELDGETNAEQHRQLQAHTKTCEACQARQAQFQAMAEGFEWLAQESETVPQTPPKVIRISWAPRVAAVAAAAAIVLLVAWPFGRPPKQDQSVSTINQIPDQNTGSRFEFELTGESFDKYLAVEQESIEPNVHIVWLYPNQGLTKKSSSLAPLTDPVHS